MLYLLKDGYSVDKILKLYSWVDQEILEGAIEEALAEAISVITARQLART
jgi:uncharacterized protein (DUF433 family)